MSKTPTPEEAAKPRKQLRALSTKLGAMADIEAIMLALPAKDRPSVTAWFFQEYGPNAPQFGSPDPTRDSSERA